MSFSLHAERKGNISELAEVRFYARDSTAAGRDLRLSKTISRTAMLVWTLPRSDGYGSVGAIGPFRAICSLTNELVCDTHVATPPRLFILLEDRQ